MITVLKLLAALIYIFFGSKAIGEVCNEKWKLNIKSFVGVGYLANIALFFIITLPVMILKLSTQYLIGFGLLHVLVNVICIIISLRKGRLFKFSKADIISLVFTLVFMVLYFLFLDFGRIETYDSYFYSVLTNNAANSSAISKVDAYTGLSNLQNFYKYMSYYYMASFDSIIFGIKPAHLVLLWPFTFMNFYLFSITAFTVVRWTKQKTVNNILSIFFLTLIISIIRAPFNALHLTTFIIPIYIYYYFFNRFRNEKIPVTFVMVITLSSIAFTSTSLFTVLALLVVILLTNSILKERFNSVEIYLAAIPPLFLVGLFVFESVKSGIVIFICVAILLVLYLLFTFKWFHKVVHYGSYVLSLLILIVLLFPSQLHITEILDQNLMQATAVDDSEVIENVNIKSCLGNSNLEFLDNDSFYNYTEMQGSSIRYITSSQDTMVTTLLINLTHSALKYSGLIFLFVYGIIKRRNNPVFISLLSYFVLFDNPFIKTGLQLVTLGLEARISLFFMIPFAIIGIGELGMFILKKVSKVNNVMKLINFVPYIYAVLIILSLTSFMWNIKGIHLNDYNYMYKVPNSIVELDKAIDKLELKSDKKVRLFVSESAFNFTMISSTGEQRVLVMNSKEYMNYFQKHTFITDKTMINDYFESEGKYDFSKVSTVCKLSDNEDIGDCSCTVKDMFSLYNIDYLVTKQPKDIEFKEKLENEYNVVWENSDYIIISERK